MLDPMQLLFDTFGLRSNIWDYIGEALLEGIKFLPANTVKTRVGSQLDV
jgi:hypothetical protein